MKYYKIVNPKGHNGMIYKEGYNEDTLPFNPNANCEKGGIYFARKDILAFLDYGTELYEVKPIGEVYKNLGEPKKYKAHAVNLKYIGKINLKTIKMLLKEGANIHAGNDYALRFYVEKGNLIMVKYLVEQGADIHVWDDCLLRWAVVNGDIKMVKYLVKQGVAVNAWRY